MLFKLVKSKYLSTYYCSFSACVATNLVKLFAALRLRSVVALIVSTL
jgi:hypothetical protein